MRWKRNRRFEVAFGCSTLIACVVWLYTKSTNDDSTKMFHLWRNTDFVLGCFLGYLGICILLGTWSRKSQFWSIYCGILCVAVVAILEVLGLFGLQSYNEMFGNSEPGPILSRQRTGNTETSGLAYQDIASMKGYSSEPISFEYVTDRYGFRNDEDRGEGDIYLVGDSILVAGLLASDQRVSHHLQSGIGHSVMNVALVSLNPKEEQILFFENDFDLREKLVLQFIFEGNDLLHIQKIERELSTIHQQEVSWSIQKSFTWNALMFLQHISQWVRLVEPRRSGTVDGQEYLFHWIHGLDYTSLDQLSEDLESTGAVLTEFRDDVEAAGGRYIVVYIPAKIRVLGPLCEWPDSSLLSNYEELLSPLRDFVHDWGEEKDIDVIDTTEPLMQWARIGKIPWFWGDTHLNGYGHECIADILLSSTLIQEWNNSWNAAETALN